MLYTEAQEQPREKRGRLIAIRLSQGEHDQLGRIAAERGKGLSTLVREQIVSLLSPPVAGDGPAPVAANPGGVLGDAPQGTWKEEFATLAARAGAFEAHRKRVSAMLPAKVPSGFREWTPEKRAAWLDQHHPIKGVASKVPLDLEAL